jgi:hypothetical protein
MPGPQTQGWGFTPVAGTDFGKGDTAEIARRLNELAKKLHVRIYGISGYRTPAHSVEVGGFANDPHTQGKAADIGVNGSTRASASQISDAELASVGLYRPFAGAQEINHVQLAPGGAKGGNAILKVAGAIVEPPGPGDPFYDLGHKGGDAAVSAAETAARAGFSWGFNSMWDAISSKAEYAGLFLLLLVAGGALVYTGTGRALGLRHQESTA